jgi:phosphoribosyl 1,2-cyclic phosphodiesterase
MAAAAVSVYALASGSSGNATLICTPNTNLLIDCGIGVRKLASLLHGRGVMADNLHGIAITHEHNDHVAGLGAMCRRTGAPVFSNAATLAACVSRDPLVSNLQPVETGKEVLVGDLRLSSFRVSHDAVEPVGWTITHAAWKMCYVTDAGKVTNCMREALQHSNFAIVEANHDVEMLRRGPYTPDMKARVASATGHLSNTQCGEMLAERVQAGGDFTAWLAHLSRVNNSPAVAKRTVEACIRSKTGKPFTIEVAHRDSPSVVYHYGNRSAQLSLF